MYENLHAAIREGNLDEVKAFLSNEKSSYFFDYLKAIFFRKESIYENQGQSALFAAIKAEKYYIYAFLKSTGLNFKDEAEQKYITDLETTQKISIKRALIPYFSSIKNSHIHYLISKSRSLGPVKNFQEQIEKLYKELNKIPEISIILKVLQYSDYLDIVLDFNRDSIADIDPTGNDSTKGRSDLEESRVYIGMKVNQNNPKRFRDRLGTIAHESAHFVTKTIYKNGGNPYNKLDTQQQSEFNKIIRNLFSKLTDLDYESIGKSIKIEEIVDYIKEKENKLGKSEKTDKIITRVFTEYNVNDWPAELVVRVPHMFAKYGTTVGREKLQAQALELLEYYEKNVKLSCENFIENSYLIKPRNNILLLNTYSGIIDRIVELDIQFKESLDLKKIFESKNKQMFLLNVKNTWLYTVNVYQSVQQIQPYSLLYNSYLFLKFDHYVRQIIGIFYNSEASNLLIIEFPYNTDKKELQEVLGVLLHNLNKKPNKKIIFIINENEINGFMATLNSIKNLDQAQNECYQKEDLKNDFILNDLTDESQKKLLEKKVTFQMQEISLKQLINNVENLKEIVNDAKILDNLINEVTIDGKLPISSGYDTSYYIERTIIYHPTIKKEIFKAETPFGEEITDVFAVSDINQENLKKLVPQGNEVQLFEGGTNDKIVRFYVLNNEQAPRLFRELCQKNPAFNVHWLEYESESNSFIWQQSQGSLSVLQQHIDSDYTKSYLETDWIQQADYYKKIIIISDTAGMGKSTILTRFSQLIKEKDPYIWLIRIDLNDHTDKLSEQKEKASFKTQEIDIAIAFLANNLLHLKTPFEQALFKHYCQHSKLIIMFDGFDEISPDYKETVIDLILTLRKSQIKQIWVTTRPNMRADLEDALQQFALVLKPFSEDDQKEFLTKFWAQKLNLSNNNDEKLKKFAGALIELLAKSINDKEKEFTGIPLQVRMLAEVFQKNCQNFYDSKQPAPTLPDKLDLIDLYELFLKKKYDIYRIEKNKSDISKPGVQSDELYSKFIEQHQSMALYTLFGEKVGKVLLTERFCEEFSGQYPRTAQVILQQKKFKELLLKDSEKIVDILIENIQEAKLRTGIISQIIGDKPHFIHRTFAEYLTANFLVNILQQQTRVASSVIQEFLLQGILIEPVCEVIRAFINGLLKKTVPLPKNMFKLYGKKIADLWQFDKWPESLGLKNKSLCNKNGDTILHIAAKENNIRIISFILHSLMKHKDILKALLEASYNYTKYTVLHIAAEKGYLDIVIYLLKKGADIKAADTYGQKPLDLAATKGNLEVVKYLVEKGADFNAITFQGTTPLHSAAYEGHLEVVKYLIEKGAGVNMVTTDNETPLHSAAYGGHLEVVKYLVEKGAEVNMVTSQGTTPLHRAVKGSNLKIVKYLIEKGAGVNMVTTDNETPLHSAAINGNLEVVKYLIEKGADVNVLTTNGSTVLHLASLGGSLEVIKYFIEKGADINVVTTDDETLLHLAALGGRLEVVKHLIDKGAGVNMVTTDNETPLHLAAINGNLEVVKYLIEKGADVNVLTTDGRTVLHSAAYGGHLEVVKYFIEKGADINVVTTNGSTVLRETAIGGNLEVVIYLIEKGADVNVVTTNGWTVLHLTAYSGYLEVVKYLIEKGADINVLTTGGCTVLHLAAYRGHLKIVKYLIEKGIDVNVKAYNIETPLHYAAKAYKLDIVKYLVENSVHVNILIKYCKTPLYSAVAGGNLEVVKYLVEHGADVNKSYSDGVTPLHGAATEGNLEVVKYLIEEGADINMKTHDGWTPIHYASAKGHLEVVKYLIEEGADINMKTHDNWTPIHWASIKGNFEVVKYLIEKAADVKVVTTDGSTVLHSATIGGNLEVVKYLTEKGADINIKTHDGWTPIHWAVIKGNFEVAKYLAEIGGE